MRAPRWGVSKLVGATAQTGVRKGFPRWLGVLLAIVALAAAVRLGAGALLGTSMPWVVTEGTSMWPTVRAGDLAIIQGVSPRSLHRGEIVAVSVPANYQRVYHYPPVILHRIRRVFRAGGELRIVTKGDHNPYPDPLWFPAGDVRGRLVRLIPDVGFVPLFVQSRYGLLAIGGLLVLALLYWLVTVGLEGAERSRSRAAPVSNAAGVDLGELTTAIHAYGQHLASHTESVQAMAASARALQEVVERQTRILGRLEQWFEQWGGVMLRTPERDGRRTRVDPFPSLGALGALGDDVPRSPSTPSPRPADAAPASGVDLAGLLPTTNEVSWSVAAVNDLKRLTPRDSGRVLAALERRSRGSLRASEAITVLPAPGFSIWLHATPSGWQVERVVPDHIPPGTAPDDLLH